MNLDSSDVNIPSGITIQQYENLIKEMAEEQDQIDQLKHQIKKHQEIVDDREKKLLAIMTEFNHTSYRSSWGMVVRSQRWSYKTPKTDDAKEAFYNYLRSKGLFDSMISVNSQTLNSFCKKEMEAAKEAGDLDFEIPGLEEPTLSENISIRR